MTKWLLGGWMSLSGPETLQRASLVGLEYRKAEPCIRLDLIRASCSTHSLRSLHGCLDAASFIKIRGGGITAHWSAAPVLE
jgi:hypothetical protein